MRTLTAAALATLTLGGGLLAASAPAQAYYKPWYKHHPHYGAGPIAAGVVGGLALGAVAASAATAPAYAEECYVTRRTVEDAYGNLFVRRVRVCE